MLTRILLMIVLVNVLTGCETISNFLSIGNDTTSTVGDTPPALSLALETDVEVNLGTHCWTSGGVGLCVDMIPPMYEADDHIAVSGDALTLIFDAPIPDSIGAYVHPGSNLMTRIADIQLEPRLNDDGTVTIPLLDNLSGEYVLVVTAFWDDYGDAFYSLPISIN